MPETIQKGDLVKFHFSSGKTLSGIVHYIPASYMDWWIIVGHGDKATYYVQTFESVTLLTKQEKNDETT